MEDQPEVISCVHVRAFFWGKGCGWLPNRAYSPKLEFKGKKWIDITNYVPWLGLNLLYLSKSEVLVHCLAR